MSRRIRTLAVGASLVVLLAAGLGISLGKFGFPGFQQFENHKTGGVIRIGHDMKEDSPLHRALEKFAKLSAEQSGGKLQFAIIPDQQEGTDEQMIEKTLAGELDLVVPPTAKLSEVYPPAQFVDLPFVFQSREEASSVLDGVVGSSLRAGLESKGLKCFEHFESGFKQFTSNSSLRRPLDFKGLRFRTMRSPVLMEQYRVLGALPIQIDYHQVHRAMADKAVDAGENSLISIGLQKHFEVQKILTISNHGYLAQFPCWNARRFSEFPTELAQLMVKNLRLVVSEQRIASQQMEKNWLEQVEKSGMTIERLTESERQVLADSTSSLRNKFIAEWNREFSLQLPSSTLSQQTASGADVQSSDEWVLGVNADLSLGAATAGQSIVAGARVAADELNSRGGVGGKRIRVEAADHGGINLRGVANLQSFSRNPNLIGVIGGIHSNVILSELDLVHQDKIPYLIPWAAAVDIVDNGRQPNFVFRLGARDEFVAEFLVREGLKKSKKIALLLESTVWGRSNLQALQKALGKRNISPLTIQWVDRGAAEVNVQVSGIVSAGADTVLMVLNAPEGALAVRKIAERGVKTRILSHWGITSHTFFKDARESLSKVSVEFFQPFSMSRLPERRAADLLLRYRSVIGPVEGADIPAPAGFAHAYDLTHLLALAVEKVGRADRAAIRNTLEHLPEYNGLSRTFKPAFDGKRHEALDPSSYFLARFTPEGKIVPVENLMR